MIGIIIYLHIVSSDDARIHIYTCNMIALWHFEQYLSGQRLIFKPDCFAKLSNCFQNKTKQNKNKTKYF